MQQLKILLLYAYFVIPHNLFIGYDFFTGIKPSDIAASLLIITLLNRKYISIPTVFLMLPFWYILRSIISIPLLGYISLAFGFKFFEYLVVVYSIASFDRIQMTKLLNVILISTFAFTLLQYFGIYWGQDWAGRYSSQYGGPYELGAVSLMLFYMYRSYLIKFGFLFLIIISESKASILSLVISYLSYKKINGLSLLVLITIIILGLLNNRVQDLLLSILVFLNTNILEMIGSVPNSYSNIEYLTNWLLREEFSQLYGLDWSTGSRIYTYILAIKSLDLFGIFFGMGPGYFGFAIDSSILRIFVETGLLGLVLFYFFYNKLFSKFNDERIKLAIFINLLLVDVFFSARFFPLMFLCYFLHIENKD